MEIEASMVYVRNAFLMKDCVPSRLTEAIAIDEMRHMNWLGDLIVKKGGVPVMEHKELDFGSEDLKGYLQKQYDLENDAVKRYQEQIYLIGESDAETVGTLKHILDEEKRHRKEFRLQLEKLKQ
ncbi:MAG: Ferritin-like domain protein [Candidatus Argoarchaeum ethanivorans]|uniref:Ferritin-like domain protein n=1 Tax=Candidatus Argoarchaeum ethanivorans TaxID=2608793 RepID=A0A811TGW3_9EURY|nr:MAG: Ferritin-like domain protein [Candidatus Argoarchaeum ethanivorans]